MGWFWLNISLAMVFFGCWAGIPLWLTLTRWNTELEAKHAEIAAKADLGPILEQATPEVAHSSRSLAYAGSTNSLGR